MGASLFVVYWKIMEFIDIAWPDPGFVHGEFAHNIANQAVDMGERLGHIHRTDPSILTAGRNQLVESFLYMGSDWLWMVDSDMLFDQGHALKLLNTAKELDVKMVSGLAFIYSPDTGQVAPSYFVEGQPPIYRKGDLHLTKVVPDRPSEVAATGLASVLVHRDVFTAMKPPRHEDYRWFDQIILENGKLSGEDVQFFVRARELGFPLVLNPDAQTVHLKTVGFGLREFHAYWSTLDS